MAPGKLVERRPQVSEEFRKTVEPQVKAVHDDLRTFGQTVRRARRTTILPASGVTTDFDELRFDAAAGRQLRIWSPESENPPSSGLEREGLQSLSFSPYNHLSLLRHGVGREDPQLLISSPYNHPEHLLDLHTLDTQNRLLALALTGMEPIKSDYATGDYLESFNWSYVLSTLRQLAKNEDHQWTEQKFYTVIFRSKLNGDIDRERLGDLDQHSHREATESGGLLKYWFGAANEGRENLATCIWRSREDAIRGGGGPWHAKAMRAKMEMYEHIGFKRYFLVVEDGGMGVKLEEL